LRVTDWADRDRGTLNHWTLDIELSPGSGIFERKATPGIAIPDIDGAGVSSAINVEPTGTLREIQVKLDITHLYIGDIWAELVAPSGEMARIRNRSGGRQQNLSLNLDSDSSTTLTSMAGQPNQGDWILKVMVLHISPKADHGLAVLQRGAGRRSQDLIRSWAQPHQVQQARMRIVVIH